MKCFSLFLLYLYTYTEIIRSILLIGNIKVSYVNQALYHCVFERHNAAYYRIRRHGITRNKNIRHFFIIRITMFLYLLTFNVLFYN